MKAEVNSHDECRTCTVRGDIEKCFQTPCSKHESWIVQELQRKIVELKDRNEVLQESIDV